MTDKAKPWWASNEDGWREPDPLANTTDAPYDDRLNPPGGGEPYYYGDGDLNILASENPGKAALKAAKINAARRNDCCGTWYQHKRGCSNG